MYEYITLCYQAFCSYRVCVNEVLLYPICTGEIYPSLDNLSSSHHDHILFYQIENSSCLHSMRLLSTRIRISSTPATTGPFSLRGRQYTCYINRTHSVKSSLSASYLTLSVTPVINSSFSFLPWPQIRKLKIFKMTLIFWMKTEISKVHSLTHRPVNSLVSTQDYLRNFNNTTLRLHGQGIRPRWLGRQISPPVLPGSISLPDDFHKEWNRQGME